MFRQIKLLMVGFASVLAAFAAQARAESGSCFAAAQMEDAFTGNMLRDLIETGHAFRFANGDIYAALENLPDAWICDLDGVDLSNLDLSRTAIDKADLNEAVLCNTVLPGGEVSHRDCR